jgi:hypothetical protein
VVLAVSLLVAVSSCGEERGVVDTTVSAPGTFDYWASPAEGCPEGDLRTRLTDSAVVRDLASCSAAQEWKDPRNGRWVADEQLLTVCTNPADVTTCRPITWAIAVPHRRLEHFRDEDFARGAIPVARITADADYPDTASVSIRGRPWQNTVYVQSVGGVWYAFIVRTRDGAPTEVRSLGAVDRMEHFEGEGEDRRRIDPPGHVLWWFKPTLEALGEGGGSGAGAGVDDGLWTRCGTGCCTISGFRESP